MTETLSQHRHISFTAHYTGYIWYQMGISHPAFATTKGKILAKLLHPLESWAERYVGGSMRTTLKQRHQMIDEHLCQLLEQYPSFRFLKLPVDYLHVAGISDKNFQKLIIVNWIFPIWPRSRLRRCSKSIGMLLKY